MKIKILIGLWAICATTPLSSVLADEIVAEKIIVGAGRTPIDADKVGRAHTVITEQQLEQIQPRYVADVLRRVPGVAVSRTGGYGGLVQIRVRGSEGNHVLVLIDGVEVSAPTQGEYDFGGLLAANIARIEVIRGPQSALWGSNATAGVINIITKQGKRGSLDGYAITELGSDRTALLNLGATGGGNRYDFAVNGAFRRTDGFNISDFGTEEDGDRNMTLNAKGNFDLTENLQLQANLRHVRRESDSDDQDFAFPATATQGLVIDTDSYTKTREYFGGVGLKSFHFDDQFIQQLQVKGISTLRKGETDTGLGGNKGNRLNLSYQGTVDLGKTDYLNAEHSLTGAVEYEREDFKNNYPSSAAQGQTQARNLYGFVAEYRGTYFDDLSVTSALRYDINDDFKNALTYSVSGSYNLRPSGTRFHASVGTGVTNPTFYEQFGFNPGTFIGDSGLKPEENFGWDLGVEQQFLDDLFSVDVTYFRERLTDEIQTVYNPGPGVSSPENLDGTSKRQGIEISITANPVDNLSVTAGYTYLRAEEPSGSEEVRRPRHSASLNAAYSFLNGKASIFSDVIYNGVMEDLEFVNSTPRSRVTLDDYVLVTIGADYKFTETVQLYGRIENLLDQQYEELYSVNSQGLTAFIGARFNF